MKYKIRNWNINISAGFAWGDVREPKDMPAVWLYSVIRRTVLGANRCGFMPLGCLLVAIPVERYSSGW